MVDDLVQAVRRDLGLAAAGSHFLIPPRRKAEAEAEPVDEAL